LLFSYFATNQSNLNTYLSPVAGQVPKLVERANPSIDKVKLLELKGFRNLEEMLLEE
jgi:hypothetical protein